LEKSHRDAQRRRQDCFDLIFVAAVCDRRCFSFGFAAVTDRHYRKRGEFSLGAFLFFAKVYACFEVLKNKPQQIKGPVARSGSNKLARLKCLSERLQGKCPNFLTREELRKMRDHDKWALFEIKRNKVGAKSL
jgi:hypothetical protein